MDFTLTINCNGGAFNPPEVDGPEREVARMLREAADKVESGGTSGVGTIRDYNGNTVCRFHFTT